MAKPTGMMKPGKHTNRHLQEHKDVLGIDDVPNVGRKALADAAARSDAMLNRNKPVSGYTTDKSGNTVEEGEE